MDLHLQDWLNLLLRWTHLITGIAWIGSSFYFMWLDSNLTLPDNKVDVEGELWMVHSGGFYLVERKRIGPGSMPPVLHWFKFEALFTWITGFFLLGVVYYSTGGAYLVDPAVRDLSSGAATAIGIGALACAWFIYDLLWQTVGVKYEKLATAISLVLASLAAVFFCSVFSGRGAFIHFGAMFGTMMVANVWVRILPAQQKMVDATKEGRKPDFTLSAKAKRRSVHNSYMTLPVLFMMLSNHYPNTYGFRHNWIVLLLLTFFGMSARHVMIGKKRAGRIAAVPVSIAALITLVLMTSTHSEAPPEQVAKVSFNQVHAIIHQRCVVCHSPKPEITTFGPMPGGVNFEIDERIHALAERIKFRAVVTKTMPLANRTQITEEERAILGHWIDQGARIDQ